VWYIDVRWNGVEFILDRIHVEKQEKERRKVSLGRIIRIRILLEEKSLYSHQNIIRFLTEYFIHAKILYGSIEGDKRFTLM
jgi:hypothetical protein